MSFVWSRLLLPRHALVRTILAPRVPSVPQVFHAFRAFSALPLVTTPPIQFCRNSRRWAELA